MRNLFFPVVISRMTDSLRDVLDRLNVNTLSRQVPIAVFSKHDDKPSAGDLVVLRRSDFEDYLGRLPDGRSE